MINKYFKILESKIQYNKIVTSYDGFVSSRKKYNKTLKEIEKLSIFIYKTIWDTHQENYIECYGGSNIGGLGERFNELILEDINVSVDYIDLIYDFNNLNLNIKLSRNEFEEFQEKFEMSKEIKKFNL